LLSSVVFGVPNIGNGVPEFSNFGFDIFRINGVMQNNNLINTSVRNQSHACSLYYNVYSTTCFGLQTSHLQVLFNNIIRVKLLIFSVDPLSHEIIFTVGVCYIAKIQYNILRLDKVLKIP
jgi:carbohydrate-binding DOMON domain-containing protein